MAFNEYDDRGRVQVLGDHFGDILEARTRGERLIISATDDCCLRLSRDNEADLDDVRAFANALLRWCDTGAL